jgi:hypothetical protein
MKWIRAITLIFTLGCIVLLLTSCSSSNNTPNIVLTFDGNTCQYDGPIVVTEGDVNIILKNKTNYQLSLWATRLDEGKTWQDVVDYIGTPGTSHELPAWSNGTMIARSVPNNPQATTYTLNEGLYAICCCTCYEYPGPKGVWPGAALEVQGK